MSFYTLPTTCEQAFVNYLAANYSGSYAVQKAFTTEDYTLPLILVKAGEFNMVEPGTHLFTAEVIVAVHTQVDDVGDALTTHDNTLAAVYDLLADKSALAASVNAPGTNFYLVNAEISSFDQDRADRALSSMIVLDLFCQTLQPN